MPNRSGETAHANELTIKKTSRRYFKQLAPATSTNVRIQPKKDTTRD